MKTLYLRYPCYQEGWLTTENILLLLVNMIFYLIKRCIFIEPINLSSCRKTSVLFCTISVLKVLVQVQQYSSIVSQLLNFLMFFLNVSLKDLLRVSERIGKWLNIRRRGRNHNLVLLCDFLQNLNILNTSLGRN